MLQSHVIEVSGIFAGVAVKSIDTFRFVAVDLRVEELDGSEWPSLTQVRRVVGHLIATGRLPPRLSPQTLHRGAIRPERRLERGDAGGDRRGVPA